MNFSEFPEIRWKWVSLALILALAAGLRIHGLANWSFEQDELYTLRDALVFGEQINYWRPLYYALNHVILQAVEPTELTLRLPAFVFGLAGVWITWELGRQVFGLTAGTVAGFLVAICPWHLNVSQFARYYSLVYLLAALVYLLLPAALEKRRTSVYLVMLITLALGGLTHPTFLLPLPGIALGITLVSSDGRVRWTWPSPREWAFVWGPLAAGALLGFVVYHTTDILPSLPSSRPSEETLRTIPAIIQWLSPTVVAAAVIGGLFHLWTPEHRRWGAVAVLGSLSVLLALVGVSSAAAIYAAYATAMLPLIYVTIGGAVQRMGQALPGRRLAFAVSATVLVSAGSLPGTVSHLIDGTRHEYRPAYAEIERRGGDRLVLTSPTVIARRYAPGLRIKGLRTDPRYLDQTLLAEEGFWIVGSYRRYGMVAASEAGVRWIDAHCRRILKTERSRIDYRIYRVELHWCGTEALPAMDLHGRGA